MGACHWDRSGFEGPWTEQPLKFDNAYFTEVGFFRRLLLLSFLGSTSLQRQPLLCPLATFVSWTILLNTQSR